MIPKSNEKYEDILSLNKVSTLYKLPPETILGESITGKMPSPWFLAEEIKYDLDRKNKKRLENVLEDIEEE